ncbi:MAG TPA: fatty acyl-AMP ligase [Thermoanaerobaculia bacterium]|nr:fatty acyl-AMP ligase [Thermoanaerobaculia bacterium]
MNGQGGLAEETPEAFETLSEVLRWRSATQPGMRAFTFLADGEKESGHLTYAELDRRARSLAAMLQGMGMQGERAVLLYPSGLDFLCAFLGCLYAGAVAVPVAAAQPRQKGAYSRLVSVIGNARPRLVLTVSSLLPRMQPAMETEPALASLAWLATDEVDPDLEESWRDPGVDGRALAMLQYTSGSTSTPKGVMVSHANLVHNTSLIREAFGFVGSEVCVSWLPLHHDMGLIGTTLNSLYHGVPCVFMPPLAFLQRPVRWLRAISRYRGTISGGPNFGYELCMSRIGPEQLAGLDLRSWRVAFNGSEPIRDATLEQFAAAFAPSGFRKESLYPCYGMAEATLLVTGNFPQRGPKVQAVDAAALACNRVVPADGSAAGESVRTVVSSGRVWAGMEVVIVDPETCESCPEGCVGEIWVTGPSVAQGYWSQPEETRRSFGAHLAGHPGGGPWLRTGDLGFLSDGELFVTGRLKDMIIIAGRNYYPQDIELVVEECHPAVRQGCSAAFSVEGESGEQLVVVAEVGRVIGSLDEVKTLIRRAVAEHYDLRAADVALVSPGGVPKTTSGKVQRSACRAAYLGNELPVAGLSPVEGVLSAQPGVATVAG